MSKSTMKRIAVQAKGRTILFNALLRGVKQVGTYDPDVVLPGIEEDLTGHEYHLARGFLLWIVQDQEARSFGHGNIASRIEEYIAAQPTV